jgi:hypothetical protein
MANKPSLEDIFAAGGEKPSLEAIFAEPQPQSQLSTAVRQAAQAATFGLADEAASGVRAGYETATTGVPFKQAYEANLMANRAQDTAEAQAFPITAIASNVAGSIPTLLAAGAAAPKTVQALTNFASRGLPNAIATSAGTGAVSGALYGFGSGEGGLQNRIKAAREMGAVGGLAGVAGAALARPVASLFERASRLVSRKAAQNAPQATAQATVQKPIAGAITRAPTIKAQAAPTPEIVQGNVVPLTLGQQLQDPVKQSLENMARGGAMGDEAQRLMAQTDYTQQDAIRGAVGKLVGEPSEDALVQAGGVLRKGFKDIKTQVGQAYDNAEVIRNVFVDKKPIAEAFVPRINDIMKKQGFDASNITGESKKLFDELQTIKEPKITALNLEKMEFWRRKAANRAEQLRGDPEGVMMKRVVSAYDDFMGKLPSEALKGGDETALKAINDARSLRRRQGVLFERNKVVEQIVKNDELTNEQLANLVLTGNQGSQNLNAGIGGAVKAMKLAAGDNAEQVMDGLRKGAMARVLSRAQTTMLKGNTEQQMLSPAKLAKELDGLLNNRSFMNQVFDEQSRNTLFALRNDVRKIASEQVGARNYSNTAYTVLRALKGLPFGLSSVGGIAEIALKPAAEKSARDTLNRSLAPVLEEVQNELMGSARIYGAAAGGAAAGLSPKESE